MNGNEFVEALKNAMPARDELLRFGLSDDEINGVQNTFRASVRADSSSVDGASSELERLVTEFDCSTVEVGLLQFLALPKSHRMGTQVASVESDALVVRADGSVLMSDSSTSEVLLDCARNSEAFLDALSAFIKIRRDKQSWMGRANEAAMVCASAAGGSKYLKFYQVMFGFLDMNGSKAAN